MSQFTRLVKLHLKSAMFDQFKEIFEYGQYVVVGSKGCHSVQLLQDDKDPNVVFTLSIWDSVDDLNQYRNSKEFKNYWPKIKDLLDEKTEVWNLNLKGENSK